MKTIHSLVALVSLFYLNSVSSQSATDFDYDSDSDFMWTAGGFDRGSNHILIMNPQSANQPPPPGAKAIDVKPDLDAILDLVDTVAHGSTAGKVIMPPLVQSVPAHLEAYRGSSYGRTWGDDGQDIAPDMADTMQGDDYDAMFPAPSHGVDNMFIMVDDPILIVGPPGTTVAPTTVAAG